MLSTQPNMPTIMQRRSKTEPNKPFKCTVEGCEAAFFHYPSLFRHRKEKHPNTGQASKRRNSSSLIASTFSIPPASFENLHAESIITDELGQQIYTSSDNCAERDLQGT